MLDSFKSAFVFKLLTTSSIFFELFSPIMGFESLKNLFFNSLAYLVGFSAVQRGLTNPVSKIVPLFNSILALANRCDGN